MIYEDTRKVDSFWIFRNETFTGKKRELNIPKELEEKIKWMIDVLEPTTITWVTAGDSVDVIRLKENETFYDRLIKRFTWAVNNGYKGIIYINSSHSTKIAAFGFDENAEGHTTMIY